MVGVSTSLNERRGFERKAAFFVFITLKPALRNTPRANLLLFAHFICIFAPSNEKISQHGILQTNTNAEGWKGGERETVSGYGK